MTIFEYMSLFRRISDFFEAQLSEKKSQTIHFCNGKDLKLYLVYMTSRELQVQVEQKTEGKNGITLLKA